MEMPRLRLIEILDLELEWVRQLASHLKILHALRGLGGIRMFMIRYAEDKSRLRF